MFAAVSLKHVSDESTYFPWATLISREIAETVVFKGHACARRDAQTAVQ